MRRFWPLDDWQGVPGCTPGLHRLRPVNRDARSRGHWARGYTLCSLVLLLSSLSCQGGNALLEGRGVDLPGHPFAATVSIVGQARAIESDPDGHYRLPYVPGRFVVRYEASGHLALEVGWDLYEAAEVEASPVALVAIPPAPGMWAVTEQGYEALPPAQLILEQESVLGLASSQRMRFRVEGPRAPWCRGAPLVYFARSEEAPGVAAYRLLPGGLIYQDVATGGGSISLSEGVFREGVSVFRTQETGSVAIVVSLPSSSGLTPETYALEARHCGEEP